MDQSTSGSFLKLIRETIITWKGGSPVPLPDSEDELNDILQAIDKLIGVLRDDAQGLGRLLDSMSLANTAESVEPDSQWAKTLAESAGKVFDAVQAQANHESRSQIYYPGLQEFLGDQLRREFADAAEAIVNGLEHCFALSNELQQARIGEILAKQLEVTMPLAIALGRFRTGLAPEPPDIPPELKNVVSKMADIMYNTVVGAADGKERAEDEEEEEDEDEGEEDCRTTQEVKRDMIQRSHEIRAGFEQLVRSLRGLRKLVVSRMAIAGNPRLAKGEYNRRMLEKMQQDNACVAWSAGTWATFLGCSKSTVHSQPSWETLLKLREQLKRDRLEGQNDKR